MSDFLTSLVAVVAVLGFMILIHEFGHYAVAKWLGVRVEQFAIGFGKRLIGFRRGRDGLSHQRDPTRRLRQDERREPDGRAHGRSAGVRRSHPRWHRFLIAIAGPTMNILLAIVLLTTVYMVHYEYPAVYDEPPVIGWVPKDTPAAKAGLEVGDRITRIEAESNVGAGRSERSAEPRSTAGCYSRAQRQNARKDCRAGSDGCRSDRIRRLGAERRHGHDLRTSRGKCPRRRPA